MLSVALLAMVAITAIAAGANPRASHGTSASLQQISYEARMPVTEPAQIGAWLRRLVGRYRVDGMATLMMSLATEEAEAPRERLINVGGGGDCVGVGSGPGVQCILNFTWADEYEMVPQGTEEDAPAAGMFELPGGVSFLDPSMLLMGIDPANSGIQYLLVDNRGLPVGGGGSLGGNSALIRTPCVNARALIQKMHPDLLIRQRRPDTCEQVFRIDARPDSKVVHMSIDFEINEEPRTRFVLTLRRVREVNARTEGH